MGRALATVIALSALVGGCASPPESPWPCGNKLSSPLAAAVRASADSTVHSVVITLADSTGLAAAFPGLRIANARVALGHCTKRELFTLCSDGRVVSIDTPKISYPK
jgi:hypothetical protein